MKTKRVGSVQICEIQGAFQGAQARRGAASLERAAKTGAIATPYLCLNMHDVSSIDETAIGVVSELNRIFKKKAIVTAKNGCLQSAGTRFAPFTMLSSVPEAADLFAAELAEPAENLDADERRGFIRLNTILPAFFQLKCGTSAAPYFAVVTNLSEGGLYAEFLDSETEAQSLQKLNPLELQLMEVRLHFPGHCEIKADAKIIHAKPGEGGVGMEFYGLEKSARETLIHWLGAHLASGRQL